MRSRPPKYTQIRAEILMHRRAGSPIRRGFRRTGMSDPHEYRGRCRRPRLPWQSPGFKIRRKARIIATLFQFNPFHIRGETYMAKIHWALACLLLFVTAASAQEHYTEGPVWQVTLAKVKPAQMDAYLTSLRQI